MNEKEEKQNEYNLRRERVVRWDNYRINQFSYANNLITTLNLAFLVFFISQSGLQVNDNCFMFSLQALTFTLLIISFLAGLMTTLNRLQDFRKTALLTKRRKKKFEHDHNFKFHSDIEIIKSEILELEKETNQKGKNTWTLIQWQIWSFVIGTSTGVIYLIYIKNSFG
jgi:hypothetical protein